MAGFEDRAHAGLPPGRVTTTLSGPEPGQHLVVEVEVVPVEATTLSCEPRVGVAIAVLETKLRSPPQLRHRLVDRVDGAAQQRLAPVEQRPPERSRHVQGYVDDVGLNAHRPGHQPDASQDAGDLQAGDVVDLPDGTWVARNRDHEA